MQSWPSRLGMVAAGLGICVIPGIATAMTPRGIMVLQVDDPRWSGRSTVAVTPLERSHELEITVAALRQWNDCDAPSSE